MEHSRVCARIDLDAVGANLEAMRQKLKKETRIIAVIKTNAYGHGAVAGMVFWGGVLGMACAVSHL